VSVQSVLRTPVSQFTLLASTRKGSKPDFHGAAGGEHARQLYEAFVTKLGDIYEAGKVKDGVFQAMMDVGLVNDGPVSLELLLSRFRLDLTNLGHIGA
jgi:D-aminoacyl-tRNA deacylase